MEIFDAENTIHSFHCTGTFQSKTPLRALKSQRLLERPGSSILILSAELVWCGTLWCRGFHRKFEKLLKKYSINWRWTRGRLEPACSKAIKRRKVPSNVAVNYFWEESRTWNLKNIFLIALVIIENTDPDHFFSRHQWAGFHTREKTQTFFQESERNVRRNRSYLDVCEIEFLKIIFIDKRSAYKVVRIQKWIMELWHRHW